MATPALRGGELFLPSRATRYRPRKQLGAGAYGLVMLCDDLALPGTSVAVKRISRWLSDLVDAKRILREVRLLRHLAGHENISSLLALEGTGIGWVSEGLFLHPSDANAADRAATAAMGAAASGSSSGGSIVGEVVDLFIVLELAETDAHKVCYSRQVLGLDHVQYFIYQILRGLKVKGLLAARDAAMTVLATGPS